MKIHIPTEQYGFIEAEVETAQEAKDLSDEVKDTFTEQSGSGLDPKSWRNCIDTYLTEYVIKADDYTNMNKFQNDVIQEIKKAFNRITTREEKQTYESNRHQED